MLSEECASLSAIDEVDEFFETEAVPGLEQRLEALAAFLPIFETPDFEFGKMSTPAGKMPFYNLSEEASRFVEMCYDMRWVRPFDWSEWVGTSEAVSLRDDPSSLDEATHEQLEKLLTVLIRQDRFVEGSLGGAYESGMLRRIVKRAAVLSELLSEAESESAVEDTDRLELELIDPDDDELHERFGLPEGYSIWHFESIIACTMDADNPGANITSYLLLAPITRKDGGAIRLRVNEIVRHGSQPSDAEYNIHDEGDTMDYILSSGLS